jgi:hypothetical protein
MAFLSARIVLTRAGLWKHQVVDLNKLYERGENAEFGVRAVSASYERVRKARINPGDYDLDLIRAHIDRHYREQAVAHPDIQFVVFFPPYTPAWYAARGDLIDGFGPLYLETKRYVFSSLAGLPNVAVFDFQCRDDFTHNLALYRDIMHFSMAVGAEMAREFAEGRDRVTEANAAQYLACTQALIADAPALTARLLGQGG